jgi:hypothetical protein
MAFFFFAVVYDLETFCCHDGKTGTLAVRGAPSFLFKGGPLMSCNRHTLTDALARTWAAHSYIPGMQP